MKKIKIKAVFNAETWEGIDIETNMPIFSATTFEGLRKKVKNTIYQIVEVDDSQLD